MKLPAVILLLQLILQSCVHDNRYQTETSSALKRSDGNNVVKQNQDLVTKPSITSTRKKKPVFSKGLAIDSSIKQGKNTFFYRLLYFNKEIFRVENQDHSIQFFRKYVYQNNDLNYECFEVADLITGVTMNVLFDMNGRAFFKTEFYDKKALGDTLKQESVDFKKMSAMVVSDIEHIKYSIRLTKIRRTQ